MSDYIAVSEMNRKLAADLKITPEIHKEDFIYHFLERRWKGDSDRAVTNYYNIGKYGASLTRDILTEVARVKERVKEEWKPRTILDFASGYGNSARHMPSMFPDMTVGACDIHEGARKFNADVLKLASYSSAPLPEHLDLPQQDIIVTMSFFSHMPEATFGRWLQALSRSLSPGGVLIFTANGYVTDATGGTGIIVNEKGFGFRPQSEQHDLDGEQYGLTISYPKFVFEVIKQCPGLRLSRFHEGLWWTTQDTYICMREVLK